MIVVSGSARSGTSMMMQTLVLLGVKTPSTPFIKEHDSIKHMNPKGFYEMYDEVIDGVHHNDYKRMAVKLFPGVLNKTPKDKVSKMIIMQRDRQDAINSFEPARKLLGIDLTSEYIYDTNYAILDNYIVDVEHIFITFAGMVTNPREEILKVIDFLGIEPKEEQINRAIKNIDTWQF